MLPSETMIWQPEFTDKTLSRKPGAVHTVKQECQEETIGIWRDRSLGRSLNKTTDRLRVGQPKADQWAYSQEGL
ncbi:hypothetical protein BMT97_11915 [Escherichia coli]|nr:hypothetical protein BMT97_11915 [Escherichia coli]